MPTGSGKATFCCHYRCLPPKITEICILSLSHLNNLLFLKFGCSCLSKYQEDFRVPSHPVVFAFASLALAAAGDDPWPPGGCTPVTPAGWAPDRQREHLAAFLLFTVPDTVAPASQRSCRADRSGCLAVDSPYHLCRSLSPTTPAYTQVIITIDFLTCFVPCGIGCTTIRLFKSWKEMYVSQNICNFQWIVFSLSDTLGPKKQKINIVNTVLPIAQCNCASSHLDYHVSVKRLSL